MRKLIGNRRRDLILAMCPQVEKICGSWRQEIAERGPRAERCRRLLRRIPGTPEHATQSDREARIWTLGSAALAAEEKRLGAAKL